MSHRSLRPALSMAALALAVACGGAGGAPTPKSFSDGDVVAILAAKNNTDILYAQLALAKSSTAAVRQLATVTLNDHQGANSALDDLAQRLRIEKRENVISLDSRDDADAKRDVLRELSGYAFDTAYVNNEVRYHTGMLPAIDTLLMPRTKRPELQAYIRSLRPAVVAHLDHARRVQTTLRQR